MNRRALVTALAVLLSTHAASAQPEDYDAAKKKEKPPTPAPAAAAPAPATTPEPVPEAKPPVVELHGYVQPQFGLRYLPAALVGDRWQYGGLSSRAGLIVSGTPVRGWSYVLHLSLDARTLQVLTGVSLLDTNGDGSAEDVGVSRRPITATIFEEATVAYTPFPFLKFKMGAMRVPFTVALRSANTQLLFANRPGANEVFQSGADQGLLAMGDWMDGRVQASIGTFTGTSLGLLPANTDARGLMHSLRVDANPLGKLPAAQTDFERGPFRFGIGVGGLYRAGTLFTRSGYELQEFRDVRASVSARVAVFGLFFQAEALRRLATDNVSSRPNQATGAYAQASYFFPVTTEIGLAPLARVGVSTEDERTLPRRTVYLEGGLAFFPKIDTPRPESVRILAQYLGENRVLEQEQGHAAILQAQVLF